jgi:hypothetical protein
VSSADTDFDAQAFHASGAPEREAWLAQLVGKLNRRFFVMVRGVVEPEAADTIVAQDEARAFMTAPTHAYPWSTDGARVLLRALSPALGKEHAHLFAATERARELFSAIGWACLTRAERARLEAGHIAGAAPAIIQTSESWQVHHGLHNDSRRGGIQVPLVASFLLAQGPSAGRLRLWPSGQQAAHPVEMKVGDLCLQRDCMEWKPGQILYPLTHGTEAATSPEGAERIVAILRFGIVPMSTVQAVSAAGEDLMDHYLKVLTRPPAHA